MSDHNLNQPNRPRDRERFAELSDLLGDIDPVIPAAPRDLELIMDEGASIESALASVDANYPIRPREVPIASSPAARSWQATPGSFSRATPFVAPIVPHALDAWNLRPALSTEPQSSLETVAPDVEEIIAPAISMPEPHFDMSDEEAFQSVLDGLEGDLFVEEDLVAFEPAPLELPVAEAEPFFQKPASSFDQFVPQQAQTPFEPNIPGSFKDINVAQAFDPNTDFDAVFADDIFGDMPDAEKQVDFAPIFSEPKFVEAVFEEYSLGVDEANVYDATETLAQESPLIPTSLAGGASAVSALRANGSQETHSETMSLPITASPAIAGFAASAVPVFLDTTTPYDEVPVTGSLKVPEFAAIEKSVSQITPDFGDFELSDFEPTPAEIKPQTFNSDTHVIVHEPLGNVTADDAFDDFSDVNFDKMFENEFSPTEELANIVGSNFDEDTPRSAQNYDDFSPMPAMPPIEAPRGGRGKWLAVGALGLALFGGLAAYAFYGDGVTETEAPVIVRADNEPVRVVPVDPEGTVVPNQDRVVFNEVGGANSVPEKPQETLIDARQVPEIAAAPVKEEDRVLTGDNSAESSAGNGTAIAPRSVQTVTVRPDGTLVVNPPVEQLAASQAEVLPETRPETVAPQPMPQAQVSEVAVAPVAEVPAANPPVADTPAVADKVAPAAQVPVRVVELKPVVQKQKAITPKAPALDVVPSRPSDQPVNIVNDAATVVPEQPAEQQSAAAETAPVPAAGSYLMQIASTPTEEAATSTLRSLSGKFGSVLAGRDYAIQKAEVPGKGTVYRVRILAGSKDEAAKLCARYKSAGGSCFVTR